MLGKRKEEREKKEERKGGGRESGGSREGEREQGWEEKEKKRFTLQSFLVPEFLLSCSKISHCGNLTVGSQSVFIAISTVVAAGITCPGTLITTPWSGY
jgi:hypothetical protein